MKLHPECFKIKDPRIELAMVGRMSLEALAMTFGPNDPFILIGDTIYVLSKDEFYATRALRDYFNDAEQTFKHVLSLNDLSFMEKSEQELVEKVRKELPTCPVCKYKRYKQSIQQLAKKYKLEVVYTTTKLGDEGKYPETTADVEPIVTTMLDRPYSIPDMKRLPCMDCVEKHVAQAHILACESHMGYPEHRILMCGHLAEAIDEAPKEFPELRQTLQNCMSITMQSGEAFLPIYSLLFLIKRVREAIKGSDFVETRSENPMVTDTIDLTPEIEQEMTYFSEDQRRMLLDYCSRIRDIILKYKISRLELDRVLFEGWIACMADLIAYGAPLFANMLRNRRLMFVADPSYAIDAGYTFDDVMLVLTHDKTPV